jgi:hypothetical protein
MQRFQKGCFSAFVQTDEGMNTRGIKLSKPNVGSLDAFEVFNSEAV